MKKNNYIKTAKEAAAKQIRELKKLTLYLENLL